MSLDFLTSSTGAFVGSTPVVLHFLSKSTAPTDGSEGLSITSACVGLTSVSSLGDLVAFSSSSLHVGP